VRALRLILALALAPLLVGAAPARDPRVLSVHFDERPQVGVPVVLRVRVKDPGAAVNGIRVDFGDGRAAYATSACRPAGSIGAPATGAFKADRTAEFRVAHTYLVPGDVELTVHATTGDCVTKPLTTRRKLAVKVRALPAIGAAPKAAPAQASGCPGVHEVPTTANRLAVKRALRCVVNAYRVQQGLRALAANQRLTAAAKRHSDDMVRRSYFAHESPSGADLLARLRKARYRPVAAGENLAAGTDALATPMAAFLGWLDSPPHKENMLGAQFTEMGVGVALGYPTGGTGATYTMTFGARR
jgi:uncharacterized protein YkwD